MTAVPRTPIRREDRRRWADSYASWAGQLISPARAAELLPGFCAEVGLPAAAGEFQEALQGKLAAQCAATDAGYPDNPDLVIDDEGRPSLKTHRAPRPTETSLALESALRERMPERTLLGILARTAHWLAKRCPPVRVTGAPGCNWPMTSVPASPWPASHRAPVPTASARNRVPLQFRRAGLVERLIAAGVEITDDGDLPRWRRRPRLWPPRRGAPTRSWFTSTSTRSIPPDFAAGQLPHFNLGQSFDSAMTCLAAFCAHPRLAFPRPPRRVTPSMSRAWWASGRACTFPSPWPSRWSSPTVT